MDKAEKKLRRRRRDAAEEVCWRVLVMMGLGELEMVPGDFRDLLGEPMLAWAELARKTGQFGEDRPVEADD